MPFLSRLVVGSSSKMKSAFVLKEINSFSFCSDPDDKFFITYSPSL